MIFIGVKRKRTNQADLAVVAFWLNFISHLI